MAKQYYCPSCMTHMVSVEGMLCDECRRLGVNSAGWGSNPFGGASGSFGNSGNPASENVDPFCGSGDPFGGGGGPFGGNGNPISKGSDPLGGTYDPFNPGRVQGDDPFNPGGIQGDDPFNASVPAKSDGGWGKQRTPVPGKYRIGGQVASSNGLEVDRNTIRGIVYNVTRFQESKHPGFLQRWMTSLFSPQPFSMKPVSLLLQVGLEAEDAASLNHVNVARSVHINADPADAGMISEGNRLVINGSGRRSGVIEATRIYNETTGTQLMGGVSPWLVRLMTLMLPAAIVYLVAGLQFNMPTFQFSQERLGTIIAVLILMLMLFFTIKNNRRVRGYALWIMLIVLGYLVLPSVVPVIITLMGIWILIRVML